MVRHDPARQRAARRVRDRQRRQRKIARQTPGFVSWEQWNTHEGETIGMVVFDSDAAVAAWRDHPEHVAVNKRGREALYGSYWVRVCELIREAHFDFDSSLPDNRQSGVS